MCVQTRQNTSASSYTMWVHKGRTYAALDRQRLSVCIKSENTGFIWVNLHFGPSADQKQPEVILLVPVQWAARWNPPPAWSPCWTCPATACPPPAGWSRRRCWPKSDNCPRCWGATRHLRLERESVTHLLEGLQITMANTTKIRKRV